MSQLLLHDTTKYQLDSLISAKPHALLISGSPGAGKKTIANKIVKDVLGVNAPYGQFLLEVSPDSSSIGIEQIRAIKDFLNRKTTGKSETRRIILINDSDTMTTEAQNALLKILEEPPLDTMIVMTARVSSGLKQTIRSRIQHLQILPVSQTAAVKYFESAGFKREAINNAYLMSDGLIGLMQDLLTGREEHELVKAISNAKSLLQMPLFERTVQIDALSKQKDGLGLMLYGLERVSVSGLRQAAINENEETLRKFYQINNKIIRAKVALNQNVNTKLVLTDLFLNL